MRSEMYLFSGAAVGMAAAVALIFTQPNENGYSSSSGAVKTFTAELDETMRMPVEHAAAPAPVPSEKSAVSVSVEREVRVILPSPYQGVSVSGVR